MFIFIFARPGKMSDIFFRIFNARSCAEIGKMPIFFMLHFLTEYYEPQEVSAEFFLN